MKKWIKNLAIILGIIGFFGIQGGRGSGMGYEIITFNLSFGMLIVSLLIFVYDFLERSRVGPKSY